MFAHLSTGTRLEAGYHNNPTPETRYILWSTITGQGQVLVVCVNAKAIKGLLWSWQQSSRDLLCFDIPDMGIGDSNTELVGFS